MYTNPNWWRWFPTSSREKKTQRDGISILWNMRVSRQWIPTINLYPIHLSSCFVFPIHSLKKGEEDQMKKKRREGWWYLLSANATTMMWIIMGLVWFRMPHYTLGLCRQERWKKDFLQNEKRSKNSNDKFHTVTLTESQVLVLVTAWIKTLGNFVSSWNILLK